MGSDGQLASQKNWPGVSFSLFQEREFMGKMPGCFFSDGLIFRQG